MYPIEEGASDDLVNAVKEAVYYGSDERTKSLLLDLESQSGKRPSDRPIFDAIKRSGAFASGFAMDDGRVREDGLLPDGERSGKKDTPRSERGEST